MRRRPIFHAVALLAALTAACDRPPPAASDRRVVVWATLYPLADIARQVGGDRVRVDWLLDLGDPIEHYTLNRREQERMAGVDLLLCDGVGRTETWAQREFDRLRETGTVLGVDQSPGTPDVPGDGLLYLDPVIAGQYAKLLASAFARRVPGEADGFRARAAAFSAEVEKITAGFTAPPGAAVLVLSNLFQPMLVRLGVKQVLINADVLHLTPRDAEAVRRTAAEAGVRAMVVPYDTPPGTMTFLEEQTRLKVVALDPLGFPNYDQHGSYLDVLRFNLEQLRLATR